MVAITKGPNTGKHDVAEEVRVPQAEHDAAANGDETAQDHSHGRAQQVEGHTCDDATARGDHLQAPQRHNKVKS
jgi:hypothetical protein